jgi:tetratricopeptide (TPR) repeat protein
MRILFPVWLATLAACATSQPPPPAPVAATPKAKPERFELEVRQDFFDGMRGDAAALDRAQKVCEDALAQHPDHAEALVWHGAMLAMRSRDAFAKGDRAKGMELYQKGTGEMDHAVELAPTSPGVRIPRGAVYLAMAHFVPQPEQTRLANDGVSDYEATLESQKAIFKTLTLHSREQLLYGLTDGYAMLGNTDKARATYERMQHDAPESELLTRAAERAAGHEVKGNTPCEQCHSR